MWIYTKLANEAIEETNDPMYIAAPYKNQAVQEYISQQTEAIDESVQFVSSTTPPAMSSNQVRNVSSTSTDFYVIFNFFSNSSSGIASNGNFMMIALSTFLTLFYGRR